MGGGAAAGQFLAGLLGGAGGYYRQEKQREREEVTRRRVADKAAEVRAVDAAEWPGVERKMAREYELRGELEDKKTAAKTAEAGRRFNEWLMKRDHTERQLIQRERRKLASNLIEAGRASTEQEALALAGEMLVTNYEAGIDVKQTRAELNEAQIPLLAARVQNTLTNTQRTLAQIDEMQTGPSSRAMNGFRMETAPLVTEYRQKSAAPAQPLLGRRLQSRRRLVARPGGRRGSGRRSGAIFRTAMGRPRRMNASASTIRPTWTCR